MRRFFAFSLLILSLALTAGASFALEDGAKRVKIIEVKSEVDCDGEDCPEGGHRTLFVGDDGDVQVVGNGDHEWFHGDHAKILRLGGHGMGGAFLGVGMSELTPELRAHFGLPTDAGVMVSKVIDDSPAARSSIVVGDVIYSVDGEAVKNGHELARRVRGHKEGDIVDFEVWRDGSPLTVTTTLEERAGGLLGREGRRVIVRCDDDEEDCDVDVHAGPIGDLDYDCGDAEECEVRVQCKDGSCDCAVNGESVDCSTIPGVPHRE